MWTRQLLKKNAKEAFRRNYWTCVLVSFIAVVLSGGFTIANTSTFEMEDTQEYSLESIIAYLEQIPDYVWTILSLVLMISLVIGICVSLFVTNVVQVGCNRYFLENREHKTPVGQMFYGFQGGRYSSTVWIMFLKNLYIWAWSLLLIVPGIVKSYSYMLVPYIWAENTNLDRKRVFQLSRQMMRGYKWEAFKLEMSFLGWIFLSLFTPMGLLSILYVNPYVHATYAEFYSAIKAQARMQGIVQSEELPTTLVPEE